MTTIHFSFAAQIPVLEKTHRVIAIEQMGHGRTADVVGRELAIKEWPKILSPRGTTR
jgi:hypothetical protein